MVRRPVWFHSRVVLAALLVAAPAAAQDRHAAAIDSARAIAREFFAARGVPGLSVAVGIDTAIVWAEGFGLADLEDGSPVRPTTRFRIGSVSKPLTAAALGLLVEQGKLELDAPIRRYVPSFPQKQHIITARQVAGHLSGIRHYRGDEFLSTRHFNSVLEGLQMFQDDSLLFEPGTRFFYSSYGWNLISAAVEAVARQDFLAYMRDHVFGPLGLTHTGADHVDSIIPGRTRFYDLGAGGRVRNAPYVDNSYKWAAGGFLSTPEDLVRFALGLVRGALLKPATVRLLWTPQRTTDGEETGYGIGWSIGQDARDRRLVSHGGGSVGGTTLLLLYPDQRVAVAVTANLSNARFQDMPRRIADLFLAPGPGR